MCKILSLIVPAYNMERYLHRCLDSLSLPGGTSELEVIIVNDGSTDATLGIARDYEARYPDVFRVIDKVNGNYGSCINAALKEVKGKFVKVLDADDTLDGHTLKIFLDFLADTDADAVISDFEKVDDNGRHIREYRCKLPENEVFAIGRLTELDEFWIHSVTYRTDIFNGLDYHQTEGIFYTDQEWLFMPMAKVRVLRYFPRTLYRYTCGRNGQSISAEVFASHIQDEIMGIKVMLEEYAGLRPLPAETDRYFISRLNARTRALFSSSLLYMPDLTDNAELVEFDEFLRKEHPWYYSISDSIEAPMKGVRFRFIAKWRRNGRRRGLSHKLCAAYKKFRLAVLG